jgi:lipoprotein-anchoring transpeptidase ErfK/SrfK
MLKNILKLFLFVLAIILSNNASAAETKDKTANVKLYKKPTIKDLDEIAAKYDIMKLNYDLQSDRRQDFPIQKSPTNVRLAPEFSATPDGEICKAVKMVVDKSDRTLKIYYASELQKTYKIRLGFSPKGKKVKRGDGKTPEGMYNVAYKNANSQYYKSFAVSYPNAEDRAYAQAMGIDPGGDIMIHGLDNKAHLSSKFKHWRGDDWTAGCIAVTNEEMDELWKVVDAGTMIEIRP